MAAVVAAAAGAPVAKHGNRAASSSSGAADVLEALGVAIDLPAGRRGAAACRRPASASASRRCSTRACGTPAARGASWASPTVFNFLGPLTNPARPAAAGGRLRRPRGWRRSWPRCWPPAAAAALVFRGDDGLDELTTATTSSVWVVRDGEVVPDRLDPSALGHPGRRPPTHCAAATPAFNAEVVRRVLDGRAGAGPRRGAAQRRGGAGRLRRARRPGCTTRLAAGLERAAAAVDDGRAAALLARWVDGQPGRSWRTRRLG